MSEVKKILYFTGTRADFGLMKGVLQTLHQAPDFEVELGVTGMHLMEEFGFTLGEIEKEAYKIHRIEAVFEQDRKASMSAFLGKVVSLGSELVEKIKPDYILLLGDRAEMLAGAIIGAYAYIPTIHVGGGDNTSTIDNSVRYAVSKLAHLHFPPTEASRQRIIDAGEEPWRCFNSGTPSLDTITRFPFESKALSFEKMGLGSDLRTQVLLLHAESLHSGQAGAWMQMVLEAVLDPSMQTVVIYPNADAGGREMIKVIEAHRSDPQLFIFPSLPYESYLHLLKYADVLIGNSSSGILEAPSFGLPVLNLGDRQRGREQADNILNVPFLPQKIKAARNKALEDKSFIQKAGNTQNPYGNGMAGSIILETLRKTNFTDQWLQK